MKEKYYVSIDLKSFYASVECVERGLDPLKTNLVVADNSRTEKTICLAVSPSLKSYGISGRPRLFEVVHQVNKINEKRKRAIKIQEFESKSYLHDDLKENFRIGIDYIVAKPRMAYYIEYSTKIYNVYLKYVSHEDIHVYSIDEVFIDITNYLSTYNTSPYELTKKIIQDIYDETQITATAGIGTNLYLAKIAMDIVSKHIKEDEDGVRIAELDEISYRKKLWEHRPITDFWRIGKGYSKKLSTLGVYTMGDVARLSLENEDILFKIFGKNAELLIDHAWGYEPCTMEDIKKYRPSVNSISSGQVLQDPYKFEYARLVCTEMVDALVLDIVEKNYVTDQIVLTIGYDIDNLKDDDIMREYKGEIVTDVYGRKVPKPAHGTINLSEETSSSKKIIEAAMKLFDEIVNKNLLVRRITVVFNRIISEKESKKYNKQVDLFSMLDGDSDDEKFLEKEKKMQKALLSIKNKHGKNAVLKGYNLMEGSTMKDRNSCIGGHKA